MGEKNNKRWSERIGHLIRTKINRPLSRRSFVSGLMLALWSTTVFKPKKASAFSFEEFFQKHYKELSPEDKKGILARLEKEAGEKSGVSVSIKDPPPLPGVEFAYCLNLSKCIGCRRCVYACVDENNQSRDPQIQYIKVLEMEKGS